MRNQKFWRKKLWRIAIDSPNSPKFFTSKVFFRTVGFGWSESARTSITKIGTPLLFLLMSYPSIFATKEHLSFFDSSF